MFVRAHTHKLQPMATDRTRIAAHTQTRRRRTESGYQGEKIDSLGLLCNWHTGHNRVDQKKKNYNYLFV